jgi:endonuclease/exonuclease/phosphatase family metal-dependent hydrolase
LAFLTLACGQPVGDPPKPPAPNSPTSPAPTAERGPARTPPAPTAKSSIRYGRDTPLAKVSGVVRLATYNVENLFDDKDDPAISGDIDDKAMTTPPERMAALAATIRALDADVLALEEVESKEALLWFRDGYLKELGYEHVASVDAGDGRGIEQAVLSRYPITATRNWPEERIDDMRDKRPGKESEWSSPKTGRWPQRWARSPLEVEVTLPDGKPLTLFVVHHKSGADFDAQRELEALQVIEIVRERLAKEPGRRLAILGDFNATPGKKSVKAYFDAGLGLVNAYERRFERGDSRDLFTTHASGRPIDYILMSPGLAERAKLQSFFVLGTPIAANRDAAKPAGYASDHFPVAVDLVLR